MYQSAIEYAERGWRVLPLNGKVPLTAHGVKDATDDCDQIKEWWDRWPSANIGCRVPDKMIVIDVDPRHGGLASIKQFCPICETMATISGRGDGGLHLYFWKPHGPISGTRLGAGIDLKTSTGYCVMPPSIHPESGRPYEAIWRPIAYTPDKLIAALRPPASRALGVPRPHRGGNGDALVNFVANARDGEINNRLYWAACRAAETGIIGAVRDRLEAAAVTLGETPVRAERTVDSAINKVQNR